jgi:protein-tyrosine-phosphatase
MSADKPIFDDEHPAPAVPRITKPPSSVLYLCNHNIIRSPMAEALTRKHYGAKVFAASAGVLDPMDTDPFVEEVMAESGIELHERPPQSLDDLDDHYFDLIVTLTPTAHHVALERSQVDATDVIYWQSGDPTAVTGKREQRLAAYRDVRDRLEVAIHTLFKAD